MSDRNERPLLEEQPPGRLGSVLARTPFVIVGAIAIMASVVQYLLAMEIMAHGGYQRADLGGIFSDPIRGIYFAHVQTIMLGVTGGFCAFAGMTRMSLRSWRLLAITASGLLLWAGVQWLIRPQLHPSLLPLLVIVLAPVPLGIAWIVLSRRNSLFR